MNKGRIQLDFDKVYETNSCGNFKIIQDMGRDQHSRQIVKIKFLDTGTEKIVRYDIAMDGKIIDELFGIDFNKAYDSIYYGKFIIVSYLGRNHESKKIVRIRFLNTGFEYNVLLRQAKSGKVKDYSVSYYDRSMSSLSGENYNEFIISILTERWRGIMNRCYNKNSGNYINYGKIGVSVSPEWQDLNKFIETVKYIPNYYKFYYDPCNYHIDKDYLQINIPKEQRIYSPQTCVFLSIVDNSNLAIICNSKDKIFGIIEIDKDKYKVEFMTNHKKQSFGIYNNIVAAANAYNYYYTDYADYEDIPIINTTFPYMPYEETQKYLVSKRQI